MRMLFVVIAFASVAPITATQAQDVRQGRALAREVCASCHAVLGDQSRSPVAEAPSFKTIAMTPGMTAAALNVWLTSHDHFSMPRIELSRDEVRNVSAYILSLKD
ncbi:c-type cytochrome [Pseudaminobacter sp. 19-2017]|uniref:C-type cytochrome n=1 Tax=Pseudaminobacter soli (ex Zhang et al. 2022) TaxID=2831468 RepID=A0A942E268_9HYPH|nr:c-type cytochrome [Pseudaminobacter soli]MBS3651592.1 c-type cytochrome [Pseudaminobacter soli]